MQKFNTFAFQRLVFEGKNEPFLLENASNLNHEFLYDNFNKKIFLNFLIIQKLKEQWYIFFLKSEALRSKNVDNLHKKSLKFDII